MNNDAIYVIILCLCSLVELHSDLTLNYNRIVLKFICQISLSIIMMCTDKNVIDRMCYKLGYKKPISVYTRVHILMTLIIATNYMHKPTLFLMYIIGSILLHKITLLNILHNMFYTFDLKSTVFLHIIMSYVSIYLDIKESVELYRPPEYIEDIVNDLEITDFNNKPAVFYSSMDVSNNTIKHIYGPNGRLHIILPQAYTNPHIHLTDTEKMIFVGIKERTFVIEHLILMIISIIIHKITRPHLNNLKIKYKKAGFLYERIFTTVFLVLTNIVSFYVLYLLSATDILPLTKYKSINLYENTLLGNIINKILKIRNKLNQLS